MKLFLSATIIVFFCASCGETPVNELKISDREKLLVDIKNGMEEEQKIRQEFILVLETEGVDLELNNKMGEVDSINQLLVISYLEKYNWPKESEVGRDVAKSFFLIIQHSNLDLMKKHFETFRSLSEIGEANKVEVAMMQDRILMC